jgi:hypothetical protein
MICDEQILKKKLIIKKRVLTWEFLHGHEVCPVQSHVSAKLPHMSFRQPDLSRSLSILLPTLLYPPLTFTPSSEHMVECYLF